MDARYGSISGTINGELTAAKKRLVATRKLSIPAFIGIVFVPVLLFVIVYWLRAFDVRYDVPFWCDVLCYALLLPVGVFAGMTVVLARTGDPVPMSLLTITALIAWVAGFVSANHNYDAYMKPYYDLNYLNIYPHVDVSKWKGSQLMDAGIVDFEPGSQLLLPKAMGFKNEDVYCVVPIVLNNLTTKTIAPMDSYDFWAVGINCCSGHVPDFHCGEYSNPMAHYGLRVLDDNAREMFRLAVQQAEATFNLRATHPVFVHWMTDPYSEVSSYYDEGFNNFLGAVVTCFAVQLAVVVGFSVVISHIPQA